MARLLTVMLMSIALFASATTASLASVEEEMAKRQAKLLFQDITCDVGKVRTRYNAKVFGPDDWITTSEVRRRLPELRDLAWMMMVAESRAARRLANPPGDWPTEIAPEIDTYGDYKVRLMNVYRQMADANTAVRFVELGKKGNKLGPGRAPDRIRVFLNVPEYPQGC